MNDVLPTRTLHCEHRTWQQRPCPRWQCLALGLLLLLGGCSSPPQFAADAECLEAADALWTAVCAKQTPLLENSAAHIEALHAEGRLPDAAYKSLATIVARAKLGDWADAREDLKHLIRAQRPAIKP